VLVADDNADVRQLWRAFLTLSGFAVSEAANGKAAIAKALEDAPDAILMDFSMPGMDGAAAGRALKADLRTAAIPVIGLTGHGPEAGAYNFQDVCEIVLEKPLNPEAVVDALRRVLQRVNTAG
jgi:CheY-like chemotaxis protein